jgi:hypothetical protein
MISDMHERLTKELGRKEYPISRRTPTENPVLSIKLSSLRSRRYGLKKQVQCTVSEKDNLALAFAGRVRRIESCNPSDPCQLSTLAVDYRYI